MAPTLTWPFLPVQDFHGQQITELLSTALLVISGVSLLYLLCSSELCALLTVVDLKVTAFFVGYIYEDIHLTLWAGLAGTLVTGLVVIPPWPFYNKHPENWLVPFAGGAGVVVDGVKVA
ncbi:microsomal signal peptidase 12 kDa subunit-domain-containing protein [Aspergillus multicolor]|uniref:signal peptidase complex subunit 1 n=1 Tax=Aspergillus multicolor TaxID=41759 RepID=UPI003CCD70B3